MRGDAMSRVAAIVISCVFVFFFFKQKTAYEMRSSDWGSDVCSSGLQDDAPRVVPGPDGADYWLVEGRLEPNIGTNGVAGRPIEEWDIAPMRFDELREGTWSVEQRLREMDLNGVHTSRPEERRVGQECVRTRKYPGSP